MRHKPLGLSSIQHLNVAKPYARHFSESLSRVRRDLKRGTVGACASALHYLADANRAAGAAHCHHASRGASKSSRTWSQSAAMDRSLGKLRQEYINRCVRK